MSPTLIPFFAAPWVIQLHILAAFFAIAGGGVQFFLPKGTAGHKLIGRLWVLSMAVVALSSFFIHEIRLFGLFSPIHLLSVMTLCFLYLGVRAARAGQIVRHRKIMTYSYVLALIITGLFTLFTWPAHASNFLLCQCLTCLRRQEGIFSLYRAFFIRQFFG